MIVIPARVEGKDMLIVILKSENVDRMKQANPVQFDVEAMVQQTGRSISNPAVIICCEDESPELNRLIQGGNFKGLAKFLSRGFKYQPEKGDHDHGPRRLGSNNLRSITVSESEQKAMVFGTPTKITACTDTGSLRYALANVCVSPSGEDEQVWLSATDGRCFAAVRTTGHVQGDEDPVDAQHSMEGKQLCPPAIIEATFDGGLAVLNGQWQATKPAKKGRKQQADAILTAPVVEGRFPRCNDVVPAYTATDEVLVLAIDAKLLARVAQAVGTDEGDHKPITLIVPIPTERDAEGGIFTGPGSKACEGPIAVLGKFGIGVIMPCSSETEQTFERYTALRKDYCHNYNLKKEEE